MVSSSPTQYHESGRVNIVAKQTKESVVKGAASTDGPPDMAKLQADLEAATKMADTATEKAHQRGLAAKVARDKFDVKRREQAAEDNRKSRLDRTIPVVIQRAKNRSCRLHGGATLESLQQIKVNREELRRLQGLRKSGHIQLIVGEIKDGKVKDYRKPGPKGE